MCMYVHVCMYIRVYIKKYGVCMYICVCMYMCVYMCIECWKKGKSSMSSPNNRKQPNLRA